MPGVVAPDPVPVDTDVLHCSLLASRHVRAGERVPAVVWTGFCGNGTSRCRAGRQPKVYLSGGIFRGGPWRQSASVPGADALLGDQAQFPRPGDGLGAVRCAELAQDVADVLFDREEGDEELFGDDLVRRARGQHP